MGVFPHKNHEVDLSSASPFRWLKPSELQKKNSFEALDKPCPRMSLPWPSYSGSSGRISWGFHRLFPRKAFCTLHQSLSLGFGHMGYQPLRSGSIPRHVHFWARLHPQGWKGSAKPNETCVSLDRRHEKGNDPLTEGEKLLGICLGGGGTNGKQIAQSMEHFWKPGQKLLFIRQVQPCVSLHRQASAVVLVSPSLCRTPFTQPQEVRRSWAFIPVPWAKQ